MAWLFKTSHTNSEQSHYPEKAYRRALCNRKHCSEMCGENDDAYKFWALFLCDEDFDKNELLKMVNYIPLKMRMIVYSKFVGNLKVVGTDAYNFYLRDVNDKNLGKVKKSKEGKDVFEQAAYVKKKLEEDKRLVIDIFKLCKKYKYKNEEHIFNIYKKLEKDYNVDKIVLHLIFNLITMPGASKDNVYSIIDYCFSTLQLCIFFENSEKISLEDETNNVFDSNTGKNNIDKNGSYNNLFEDESETQQKQHIKKETSKNQEDIFSKNKMRQIIDLVIEFEFETFFTMLDVAITSNLTFEEVILQAKKFSEVENNDTLIKVLGARANLKYYKPNETKPMNKVPERKEIAYFDFLIILNETIKAQENMKERYEEEIKKLKNKK